MIKGSDTLNVLVKRVQRQFAQTIAEEDRSLPPFFSEDKVGLSYLRLLYEPGMFRVFNRLPT